LYRSNGIRSIAVVILFIAIFGLSIECAANEKSMGQAVVSADTQKAFVEASSSSNLVALLKKGEVVSIILRISTAGEDWCRILLPGQGGAYGLRAVQSSEFRFSGNPGIGNWSDSTCSRCRC